MMQHIVRFMAVLLSKGSKILRESLKILLRPRRRICFQEIDVLLAPSLALLEILTCFPRGKSRSGDMDFVKTNKLTL